MRERIELRYDEKKIETARRLRLPLSRFEYAERVPVVFGASTRFVLHARGVGFLEYFSDPVTHLRHQLLNHQWKLEHLPGDWVLNKHLPIAPDFQQGAQAGVFEATVDWRDDVPPTVFAWLGSPDDVMALERPPLDGGQFGRMVRWREAMREAADQFEVTFNGEAVPIQVGLGNPGGPFPKALALAQESIFVWAGTCPEVLHRLMALCTEAHIRCERWLREKLGRPMTGFGGGCDGGEMFSPAMFREFVSPYHLQVYDAFPGARALHMCGRIDHLLEILADEWRIGNLTGFGSVTDKAKLAATLGGRVQMHGGVDCWALEHGSPEDVRREALANLAIFAPAGGYMLCDGYNLAPGTPLENLQAMVDAAIEYGHPAVRS